MNLRITQLELVCRRSVEVIPFADFNYFYGEIGAGKSTIARLIDYCFGGELVMTPALQSEFVEVSLYLTINGTPVILTRQRDSNQIKATWGPEGAQEQVSLPVRKAQGVIIAGTEVAVLSDLLFYLAGLRPPKVRRSRTRDEADLERLSFRDLFAFCYLDQDNIDSSFFHLDRDAEFYRRLKSLNVLRFILGYHQEKVAELEVRLEELRQKRLQSEQAAIVLKQTLADIGLNSEVELDEHLSKLKQAAENLRGQLAASRVSVTEYQQHAADELRHRAQHLAGELEALDDAIEQIGATLGGDQRHLNEILALSTKVQRVTSARAILNGVEFERCPRCTQHLPIRETGQCPVCAQTEPLPEDASTEIEITRKDFESRVKELREIITRQNEQLKNLRRRRQLLTEQKGAVDVELDRVFRNYDPSSLGVVRE